MTGDQQEHPAAGPLLQVTDLVQEFPVKGSKLFQKGRVSAVAGVSFGIARGETLALVGETGSGKSTVARALLASPPALSGSITLNGRALPVGKNAKHTGTGRAGVQMVFQDPFGALDPRWSVARSITEPLVTAGVNGREERRRRVAEIMHLVGLDVSRFAGRLPRELSGGQAQRVAIARALVSEPDLLILDEPVTALDVSVQAQVSRHVDLALAGKRAIVTGGIGIAIVRQLALEGVRTAVCSRSLDRAKDAIVSLGLGDSTELMPVEVQLKDPDSVAAMVATVANAWGGVDILVNSAAEVSGNVAADFDHVTDEFVLSSFEDKFVGILRVARNVVPFMREQRFGRIINLAGSTARHAGSISAGARNSAVVNLTKAMAVELGKDGITVNAVHPFTTVTENLGPRLERMAARRDVSADEHLQKISASTSLGRLVTAEEIADFVTFLASPRSVSLTGEVLALTGGLGANVYF